MGIGSWMDLKIKSLKWIDLKFIKLATAAAVLMIAKLWAPLLSLDWYWYGLIFVLAAIKPAMLIFRRTSAPSKPKKTI